MVLTSHQAKIVGQILTMYSRDIIQRWSPGICEGLMEAMRDIEEAGGVRYYSRDIAAGDPLRIITAATP